MKPIAILLCALLASYNAVAQNLDEIRKSGTLRVGTTGDYKPFTYDNKGQFEGFDIEMAQMLADKLGVKLELVHTSWPNLMNDLQADKYDIGMGGVSRTVARQLEARYSMPYLTYGKTPLVRNEDAQRYQSLADIDQPDVRVGVNPGGTNEKFVRSNIKQAQVTVFDSNLAIPVAVAEGKVDVMLTDSSEAVYYSVTDARLSAPLANSPFTKSQMGYIMSKDSERLQDTVDFILETMILTGELDALRRKHMLAQ